MKKNKLYSTLLSVLLMVPGQVLCSQQPSPQVPQGILDRLYLSVPAMPAAPEWLTNITNLTSGLSDSKKYFLYGALAAFLGYIGYKLRNVSSSGFTSINIPTSMETRDFYDPNYQELNSTANCSNIAYITRGYITDKGDFSRELAFKHYVCPILKHHANDLDTAEKWEIFLKDVHGKPVGFAMGLKGLNQTGLNMFVLMKKTCSDDTKNIKEPLKKYLETIIPHTDTEGLKLLNQQ